MFLPTSSILDIRADRGNISRMEETWLNREFGSRLRERRKKAELSQDGLASAAGLSRTSVVNIERGRQGVSLATIYRLAEALGCASTDLLPPLPETQVPRITIGDQSSESRQAVMRVMQRAQERDA